MRLSARLRSVGAAFTAVGLLFGLMLVQTAAVAAEELKKPPAFVGYCEPDADPATGSCVLDEPEGQDPETHGIVTYARLVDNGSDTLRLGLPTGIDVSEIQVCLTLSLGIANPYVPTQANTCAGAAPDRAYDATDPPDVVDVDVDAFFASDARYEAGAALWFTVHVVADGRTLAVTGGSSPRVEATRSLTVTKDFIPDTPGGEATFTVDCLVTELGAQNVGTATITNGDASFVLGDGGVKVITGIVDGDQCVITEVATGYETTAAGSPGTQAIVFLDGNTIVPFVNRPLHTLSVMKTVVGSDAEFQFTVDCSVTLSPQNNESTAVTYLNGDAIVRLGDGDALDLKGLSHGVSCTVSEVLPQAGGSWRTLINGLEDDNGVTTVVMNGDVGLVFRNELATPVPQPLSPSVSTPTAAQVLGETQERDTLAATGDQVAMSLVLAISLLFVGAAAVLLGARGSKEEK